MNQKKKTIQIILIVLALVLLLFSCKTSETVADKSLVGYSISEMNKTDFSELKNELQRLSVIPLKDTIVIKYDFNGDNCWERLQEKSDYYIIKLIQSHHTYLLKNMVKRPSVSILNLRENGTNFSKHLLRNQFIKIDSFEKIQKLISVEKSSCGTSIIVLPDGNIIQKKEDPHFELLEMNKRKIQSILELNARKP